MWETTMHVVWLPERLETATDFMVTLTGTTGLTTLHPLQMIWYKLVWLETLSEHALIFLGYSCYGSLDEIKFPSAWWDVNQQPCNLAAECFNHSPPWLYTYIHHLLCFSVYYSKVLTGLWWFETKYVHDVSWFHKTIENTCDPLHTTDAWLYTSHLLCRVLTCTSINWWGRWPAWDTYDSP